MPGFFCQTDYTPLNTLSGEWVITRQVANNPLLPTKSMPSKGPVSQSTALK